METKLQAVIAKIQKLRNLSTSANIHEATTAAALANKLIEEYRLSEMDLAPEDQSPDPMVEDDGYIYETGRVIPWKAQLVRVLATHYGCAHFNDVEMRRNENTGRQRKASRYKLVGRKSDIDITRYMYAWLSLECQRLADQEVKGNGHVAVFSYCNGFVAGIDSQLQQSKREAQAHATSNAIVKLDGRLKESKDFMYSQHKLVQSKGSNKSQYDAGAFSAGHSKGKSMHLGSAMSSGSKTKLLKG